MATTRRILDRRQFLILSGLAAASGSLGASAASRPNILIIMTDQQCAAAMSCAGNADVKTPAMDRLAANGARFERAYCSDPLCVPSRTTMLTGKMPHETGITTNRDVKTASFSTPLLGRFFSDAGYDCGYAGKWHLPVNQSQTALHGFGWFPAGREKCPDARIAEAVAEFAGKARKGPFLMVASFLNPHDICQWARGERLPEGPIPDPPPPAQCPELPDNFAIPENEPEVIRNVQRAGKKAHPTLDWTPDKWRQYRWAYYRLIEKVDAQIGDVLDALQRAGAADNTLVVFTADHGDGAAAHHWNQKQALYEEPTCVPFIVSGKRFTQPGLVDRDHLVSSGIDLIPTLCDYAGIPLPDGLRGRSVRPIAEGGTANAWRDSVVVETEFDYGEEPRGIHGRLLRTARYKYVVYSEGANREQLFDLELDRGELKSLALAPDKKAILQDCRNRLRAWCRETGDAFKVPED